MAFCAIVTLMAGCAWAQSINPAAQTPEGRRAPLLQHFTSSYRVLFNFHGDDGAAPLGDLLAANDTLYGTTSGGGANGMGTVFSITTAGTQKVLYSFKGGSDGSVPTAGLIKVDGTLYGTTYSGGKNGDGTVFSVSLDGAETVLHSFAGGTDGAHPRAGLTNDTGTLYGTTEYGGDSGCGHSLGCGTIFSITSGGKEAVLYSFLGGKDGKDPRAGLTLLKGALYGTTRFGGTSERGTVFGITTAGKKSVLWNFERGGIPPGPIAPEYGSLLALNGELLGAASAGENHGCGGIGCGSIYAILPAFPGQLSEVWVFTGGRGGGRPFGSLISVPQKHGSSTSDVLFGTTFEGGADNDGTVFAESEGETVLHSFAGGKDGGEPYGGLALLNGTLYGTTSGAGSHGTVFAVTT
jgi:uncharacterized repeat protein (TIGR03803 family)